MLTVKDIAEDLSYCPNTVKRWIRMGRIKATKVGVPATWVISEEDYKNFLENNSALQYAHDGNEGSKKYLRCKKDACTDIIVRVRETDKQFDTVPHSDRYREGWKAAIAEVEKIIQDEYGRAFRGLQKKICSY